MSVWLVIPNFTLLRDKPSRNPTTHDMWDTRQLPSPYCRTRATLRQSFNIKKKNEIIPGKYGLQHTWPVFVHPFILGPLVQIKVIFPEDLASSFYISCVLGKLRSKSEVLQLLFLWLWHKIHGLLASNVDTLHLPHKSYFELRLFRNLNLNFWIEMIILNAIKASTFDV